MERDGVTQILERVAAGHASAAEELLPLVYNELRRLAQSYMKQERSDHTLQATALANEVCVRLLGAARLSWQSRAHFMAIASRAMRQVLASHARERRAVKRRAPGERVTLAGVAAAAPTVDLIALDETLTKLMALNPEHASLVELRYFGGLSLDEMSLVLGTPKRTLERRWRAVQAWLAAEIDMDKAGKGSGG